MSAIIDFTNFEFTAEQIRDVNDLIFDEILQAPEITLITTLYPGIVFDKEIGFIGEGGLVGKKRQGCDPQPQQWKVGTRVVTWEPKGWEILIKECWTDLEATAAVYALKTGVDIADFTDSDYYAIIVQVLSQSIKKFIIRLFWFNDTDAELVDDGGIITDGTDLDYFNILDGLFKQLLAQIAVNPKQRVVISENAGASYTAQQLSPANVKDYLQKLKFNAPITLRGRRTSAFIACTQSFYDAWEAYLEGKELETTYANLVNGQNVLTYSGIPLIPMPIWDEIIAQYEDTGKKLNNPHRALYVIKEVLAVGVDGTDSFEKMNTWYEKKERAVYTELMGKADAKLLNPAMFQLAI
jgi:hypothetical protein